jgi:hypothetical protein
VLVSMRGLVLPLPLLPRVLLPSLLVSALVRVLVLLSMRGLVLLLETARLRRWYRGAHWSGRHLLCPSGLPRGSQLLVLPQVLRARLCVMLG